MEFTEIDRSANSQFQHVIAQTLTAGMNLVYTAVPRSGLTTAISAMAEAGKFGSDYAVIAYDNVYAKKGSDVSAQRLPTLVDRMLTSSRSSVIVIDAVSRNKMPDLLTLLLRGDTGPVLLFDPEPSCAVVSAMSKRPVVFACDPHADAHKAQPIPLLTRATVVKGKTLCITADSKVGRCLGNAASLLGRNVPELQTRGRYLLHLVVGIIAKHETQRIILSDSGILSNDFVCRSLSQVLPSKGLTYGSAQFMASELHADVIALGLYQQVNAEVDRYVTGSPYDI